MNDLLFLFLILSSAVVLLYTIKFFSLTAGWLHLRRYPFISTQVKISVVIAARNEQENIRTCLLSVLNQKYSNELYDVIVVDDHSNDATASRVEELMQKYSNVKLIRLSGDDQHGKKNAIKSGIANSQSELIVTTDADCIVTENWLSSIASFYVQTKAKMIVGPVVFQNENSFFEKMQSMELVALIASGAGSLHYNKPVMCNGANLIFERSVFAEVSGYDGIDGISTGDDVLLMYKIEKKHPGSILFFKDTQALVSTSAQNSLKNFLDQRKRWTSKPFMMLNFSTKYLSLLVFFTNLTAILLICSLFCCQKNEFYPFFSKICLILLGIKCFIDFLLLFLASSFFDKRRLLWYFLPEQLIYMFYVVIVGLMSFSRSYSWKGRNY
ncbi:MAG: glycosyltransferase [Bacteroidetes bacterium]|nr:glycosyltransferase [Bacteroidota bacterium]